MPFEKSKNQNTKRNSFNPYSKKLMTHSKEKNKNSRARAMAKR
jgi:hypothetical protein